MPVAGRKPNPDGQRRNRTRPAHDWVEVENAPFEEGPRLPRLQPGLLPWPKATRLWWQAISRMPHCVLWTDSDWQFAQDTALVAAAFHIGEAWAARELRQREKILGVTADARRDLRIRYVDGPPEDERLGVAAIDDYRSRLVKKK